MKIRDLLQEAQRLAPDMMYEAIDTREFDAMAEPVRYAYVTKAFSKNHGPGSIGKIELQMVGEHVVRIVASESNQHWQVSPLVEALRAGAAVVEA